jgi:large subunit ribosomal protein L28
MAKCAVTGAATKFGNSRPWSKKISGRAWKPNLQKRRMMIDGKMQTVTVSVKALRTMAKAGR